jgi:hypothetical protein
MCGKKSVNEMGWDSSVSHERGEEQENKMVLLLGDVGGKGTGERKRAATVATTSPGREYLYDTGS